MDLSKDFSHSFARLQELALPSSLTPCSDSPSSRCTLGAPFDISNPDERSTFIDAFPLAFDLSPTSSASSDFDSLSSYTSFPRSLSDAFAATRSRVVRVCGTETPSLTALTLVPPPAISYTIYLLFHLHYFFRKVYVVYSASFS